MIEIINGYKEYNGKVSSVALKNINISFADKGFNIICGVSGSGKTTLINCIAGLDKLTTGQINGCEKEDIGFIFQDFALIDNLSIYDNLKIAYDISNKTLSIEDAVHKVNMFESLDKKINELSGGQKQRVAIARALLVSSKIIIADEPTGNLDKENSIIIAKLLKDISKEKLVIVVTHDNSLFEPFADRIVMIDDGQIVSDNIQNKQEKISENVENKRMLTLKLITILRIFLSSTKCGLSKLIVGVFIVFLSMFSIILMFNTLSVSKNDMVMNSISEYNINVLNFIKKNDSSYLSIEKEDLIDIDYICQDYCKSYTSNYKCEFLEHKVEINRVYETDVIKERLIKGSTKLMNDDAVVSYSLGRTIQNIYGKNNIEDIIGLNVKVNNYEVLISGVAEKIKSIPNRKYANSYQSLYDRDAFYIYVNESTLSSILYGNVKEYSHFNTKYIMNNVIYDLNFINDLNVTSGNVILNDGEIILSERDIDDFCGSKVNPTDLINKNYEFEFFYDNRMSKKCNLKIVGYANYTVVNSNTYLELFEFSTEFFNLTRNKGIAIFSDDLSADLLGSLEKINIVTDFCLYENIGMINSTTRFLGLSMIIVVIPVIIIVILFLLSYSKQNIILKKKEIGILKSLGLPNKEICKIFILDSALLIFISTILTFVFSPIGIYLVNSILIKIGSLFNPISNNPIFVLILVLISIVIFGISIMFNLNRLNKKSDVDLVYGR